MNPPLNPIQAVTHPDPYGYYARLVAERPVHRDETLGLWIAAGAEAVASVLGSEACRVRPPREPVPKALVGSPAGEIFRHLVRMNDGAGHCPFKRAVAAALASIDPRNAGGEAACWAVHLAKEAQPSGDLAHFAFALPAYVVGKLLGVADDRLGEVAVWTAAFVRCLSSASSAAEIAAGKLAAGRLIDLFRSSLATAPAGHALLASLAREAGRVGCDDTDVIVANGIGFLFQAYEATAGLIGNTLVLLAKQPERRAGAPDGLDAIVAEVARWDPPVQNTRRFLAHDAVVAGQAMKEGEAILVVLAAANRDPAANPAPERFDPYRAERRSFTFGLGVHACPGEKLANRIATAGVAALLARGLAPRSLAAAPRYRPSPNTRIPVFAE
ncbi:MAG: cytochrome P450 [Alphaproteobacteria bacterium]|nr:cytochrome P450 [Alphaproteobacteria bacterium]